MKAAWVALAAILALCAVPVFAVVVTVTPVTTTPTGQADVVENQLTHGWSIVTNRFGVGEISPTGPSMGEILYPWNTELDGSGLDMGRGAFMATCEYNGQGTATPEAKTPSTIFLGVDEFNGQPLAGIKLNQIKSLNYWSYVSKAPNRMLSGSSPDNWDSWSMSWLTPNQPIQVHLTVRLPAAHSLGYGPFYDRFCLQYRPWGSTIRGDDKFEDGVGYWKFYNCIATGRWMRPDLDKDAPVVEIPNWYTMLGIAVGPAGNQCTIGDCELVASTYTYTKYGADFKSPGWNGTTIPEGWMNTNGTGKAINLTVGARMSVLKWPSDPDVWRNWAHMESIGARMQMDLFTLGIDLNNNGHDNDAGEKVTYNFEPAADDNRPRIAYISQKDLRLGGVNTILENRPIQGRYDTLFKVGGRTTAVGNLAGNPWYEVDDGSGLAQPVRTYTQRVQNSDNLWLNTGQYRQAWGHLEIPRWPYTVGTPSTPLPYVLWTDEGRVQRPN